MLICALRLVKAHDLFQYKDMDDVTGNFFWRCAKWLEVFQVKASEKFLQTLFTGKGNGKAKEF